MKKLFLTLIVAFATVCGFAQEKVWEDVVTGYRTSTVFDCQQLYAVYLGEAFPLSPRKGIVSVVHILFVYSPQPLANLLLCRCVVIGIYKHLESGGLCAGEFYLFACSCVRNALLVVVVCYVLYRCQGDIYCGGGGVFVGLFFLLLRSSM